MTSSTDTGHAPAAPAPVALPATQPAAHRSVVLPDLRSGTWTRLGGDGVLGDPVTEHVLGTLAEQTREAARAQGYAAGWAEGRRAAAEDAAAHRAELTTEAAAAETARAAEHAAALATLERAAARLQQQSLEVARLVEDASLTLARELTTALVGHELATAADPAADTVRRVLAVLPGGTLPVTLRVPPAVAALLTPHDAPELAEHAVQVVADPALGAGDAVVETDAQVVDLRVTAALERVREVLS